MVRDDTPIGLSPGRARDSPSSFWLVLVSMSGTATVSFYLLYWSNNFAEFRPIVETHPRSQPSIGVANVKPCELRLAAREGRGSTVFLVQPRQQHYVPCARAEPGQSASAHESKQAALYSMLGCSA
jgi:hypothetical protein